MWASSRGQLWALCASVMIPGAQRPGLILGWVTGSAAPRPSGWAATGLFHLPHPLTGSLHLCTWLAAPARAAVLHACQLITAQSGR